MKLNFKCNNKDRFGLWKILKNLKTCKNVAQYLNRSVDTIRHYQSKNGVIPNDIMRIIDLELEELGAHK